MKSETKKPRGRPRKSAPKKNTEPKLTAESVIELAKTLDDSTKAQLADVLGVAKPQQDEREPGQGRKVDARPQIADPEVQVEIPEPPPPEVPTSTVVYKSPHMGFHQVLAPSRKIPMGDGDVERVPPKMAQFDRGVWVPNDDEEIELMDRKIEKKRRRGTPIEVKKFDNEQVKQAALKGVAPIRSKDGITVDTPAEDLIR